MKREINIIIVNIIIRDDVAHFKQVKFIIIHVNDENIKHYNNIHSKS